MKKFLTTGILALTLAALTTQEAPAWLNWKFGVGMNFGWQSGGNNTLWGLFRNGQPPAPDICGGAGPGGMLPPGPMGPMGPGGPGVPPPGLYGPSSMERPVDAQAPTGRVSNFSSSEEAYSRMVNYTYNSYPYYSYGYSR